MPPPPRKTGQSGSLVGKRVDQTLDMLVELDPRYQWLETDGVIVVRPVAAWQDRKPFLHRPLPSFTLASQTISGALATLQTALGPWAFSSDGVTDDETPGAAVPISVSLGATTVLEAFNAVVRAHGALGWRVDYCHAPAAYENAKLSLFTFDGIGRSGHAVWLRDGDGRRYDPCGVPASSR